MSQIVLPDQEQLQIEEKIGVVIPAYGESDSIVWTLKQFPQGIVHTICLIIDVPTKQVMNGIRKEAEQNGITTHIIKNPARRGIGKCISQGLDYLRLTDHTIAVVMAGNGKDDPREIERLLEPVVRDRCDYVQGSRYLKGGRREKMPPLRRVFNRVYPKLWTLVTQRGCTDVTNSFRCFRLNLLDDRRIDLNQRWLRDCNLQYYLHYKVLSLGYRVGEVPVSKTYPSGKKKWEYSYKKNRKRVIEPLKDWWPIISPILLFFGVRN